MAVRSFAAPAPESLTMGCEEEFQIVDPATGKLASRAAGLKEESHLAGNLAPQHELHLCQIETATGICGSLGEVREQLGAARRDLKASAAEHDLVIAASGTHAFSDWHDQSITPMDRYLGMAADYQYLVRELLIFGQHVHIGIEDPDLAVETMNRSRVYLADLLALTSSSPFWLGEDTG
ncbi:MAG: glutamate-cysteine ligase family protein, partial [Planctomycetota bacterium]